MQTQLFVQQWLTLSAETRKKFREVFKMNPSSFCEVVNNQVKSDGFTDRDLAVISIENMKAFTKLDSNDFGYLFTMTLDKICNPEHWEYRDKPVEVVEVKEEPKEEPKEVGKKVKKTKDSKSVLRIKKALKKK